MEVKGDHMAGVYQYQWVDDDDDDEIEGIIGSIRLTAEF